MENTESRLAKVILGKCGDEDKFDLTYMGIKFKLGIKPLSGTKVVKISEQVCKMSEIIDEQQTVFQAMMEHSENIKFVCNAIAIATGSWFTTIVAKGISRLSLEDIETLWNITIRQSNAAFFLNIMVSAKQMNLMKKKAE